MWLVNTENPLQINAILRTVPDVETLTVVFRPLPQTTRTVLFDQWEPLAGSAAVGWRGRSCHLPPNAPSVCPSALRELASSGMSRDFVAHKKA